MSHARGGSIGEGQKNVRKSLKRSRIILGAAVASALAGMTASSARADIVINGVLPGGNNQLLASWYDTQIDQGALGPGLGTKFDRLIPPANGSIEVAPGLLGLVPNGYSGFNILLALSDQGQAVGPIPTTDVRNIADPTVITNHGDFAMALTGTLTVSAANAGTWQFATNSDDGSVIWIDLNGNGIFENTGNAATNELIVANNFDQGPTTRTNDTSHPALNLAAGNYKIAIGWFEGRVTGSMIAAFNNPTTLAAGANPADPNTWALINPGDVAQDSMWSYTNTNNAKIAATGGDVTVAPGASENLIIDATRATMGNLTLGAGSTLNISGSGPAKFSATTASGTVTVNNSVMTHTGVVGNGGGTITRINKQGTGLLALDDLSNPTGLSAATTVSVQNGIVLGKSDGGSSTLNGATISLDGGTFRAQSTSGISGFNARYYNGPNAVGLVDPISNLLALTPSGTNGATGVVGDYSATNVSNASLAFSDGSEIGQNISTASGGILGVDNFTVLHSARMHITSANAGVYEFSSTSDDGTVVWIDLNHDGKFTYSANPADNELILNNNVYQGPTHRTNNSPQVINGHVGHPNLNLAAGEYDVLFGWYEGGGGAEASYFIQGPATGGTQQVVNGVLQPYLWTSTDGGTTDANFSSSNVVVTADSAIDVMAPTATFGNLTVNAGKKLTVTGVGSARFAQTTASGGSLLIDADPWGVTADVALGRLISAANITKGGGGALILDYTATPSPLTAANSINVTKGTLVATADGTNPIGGASVTLADASGITLASKAGAVTFANTVNGSGNFSVTAANRGQGGADSGVVTLNGLGVAAGSTVTLATNNNYTLTIGQSNLAGNATFINNSSDTAITLGNITGVGGGSGSVINMNGANRTRITGNIVGNNVIINSPGVDLDPGAAITKTVNANTQVTTNLKVASGVIDYGQNVISGVPAHFEAGLWEGRLLNDVGINTDNNNYNKTEANPNQRLQLTTRMANQPNRDTGGARQGNPIDQWDTNTTFVYTGQMFFADNDVAGDGLSKVSFGEHFDDWVQVKIDGAVKLEDIGWNVPTTTGPLIVTAGWHDVEFRFGQGVGGVGSADTNGGGVGWPNGKAFGVDFQGRGTVNGNDHTIPVDNGAMNLFRALVPTGGVVDVAAGSELKVGGLTNLAAVNLNTSKLTLNNHATASNSDVVSINADGSGASEVAIGTNTTVTANNLNIISSGTTLTKSGPGLLRVATAGNLQGPLSVTGGKLQWNGVGTGPGGATVESGATLGGSGTFNGDVTVNTGGSISPHDGTGVATLTLGNSLTMNPLAKLDYNIGGTSDSVNVLNNLTLSGNTTLNINAITGFTVGTYRLATMTNFTDTGDVVIGSNNGPAAFNYSIVETLPAGGNPGHIDLVVTTQQLKWTGTASAVWDINGAVNWQNAVPAPAKYIDLTAVTFDNLAATNRNVNITATEVRPASITVNNDAAHNYSIGGNPIAGPTGVLKQGVGTLSLTGSNTYIGPVSVEEGTLDVNALANGGVASPLGAGTAPISLGSATTGATLRYSGGAAGSTDRGLTLNAGGGTVDTGAQNATFGGVVSGAGNLSKTGAGTLTLSGTTNTYTGSINVNNGTLSTASMGIGASPAMINLASGTTFEYSGPNQSGGRGITTTGTAGTVRISNAATNLSLSGAVSGPTINKSGPGTLTLGGLVNFSGTSHNLAANSGTLAYMGTSGNTINGTYGIDSGSTLRAAQGAIGTVAVSLNGGRLALAGPTAQGGLFGEFYQFGPNQAILNSIEALNQALIDNAGTKYATTNTSTADADPNPDFRGSISHIAGGGNPFSQYIDDTTLTPVTAPGGFDNLVTRWTGTINISAARAGLTQFFTASDDGSRLWIDGQLVVDNNFFQGTTERGGSINLSEGAHSVVIGFYEGGGDASMVLRWIPVGGAKEVIPNNVFSTGSANWNNNVSTTAGTSSTIDVTNAATANLLALNLANNSTLAVTSGAAHFTGTTLGTPGGTYTVNSGWDVNLNQVTGSGTINHSGIGTMILETNNLAGPGAGSVINVQQGNVGAVGNAGSTNPLGAASVNLSNNGGILLSAVAGDVTFNTPVAGSGTVRITAGKTGSGTDGPHILTLGSAANPVSLAAGTTAGLGANNGTSLRLPAVQLAGDATLSNNSSSDDVSIGNINITGSTATFAGSRQITVTGNITGAVTGVTVRNAALNVNPGAAATSNINGPVKVITTLNAASGTTNLGNNVISGQAAVAVAGLNEYFADGAFYEGPIAGRPNSFNVPDSIQLYPRRANQAPGDTNGDAPGVGGNADVPGWRDNATNIYAGQILVPDNDVPLDGVGHVAFMMRFDDSISLKIDGVTVMRDTTWNNATSTGEMVLRAGWHDIEMRFGEGGGGVGPNNGWAGNPPNQFADGQFAAIGYQTDSTLGFDGASGFTGTGDFNGIDISKYFGPRDDGTQNMFRIASQTEGGVVNVAAGASLVAGGVADLQELNLNAGAGTTNTLLNNSSTHSGSAVRLAANGDPGATNNLTLGANNTLNVHQMVVASGTILNKNGAGTLRTTTLPGAAAQNVHNFANDSVINVNGGKFIVNTVGLSGTGSVNVAGGATLGGKGSITGAVSVGASGHIAPGDSIGTLTVGGLALNSSAIDIEAGAAGVDKIKVASDGSADVFSLAGNSSVNLFDLGGAVGNTDYVIIDYNNTAAIADALSHLTLNAGPFSGSFLVNDTANQDIVLHLGNPGPQDAIWNVDGDGSWGVAGNWLSNSVPDSATAIASFTGKITAPRTVNLDGNRTVATLNFDNANAYTIASGTGGTLTVNGAINLTGGSHNVTAPLAIGGLATVGGAGNLNASGGLSIAAGQSLTKSGAGTLSIGGAQGHGAGAALNVTRGTVNLNSNAGTAGNAAASNLSVTVNGAGGGAARVNVNANQDLTALNVAFGDAGSQTVDLASPAGAGQFHSVTVYAANLGAAKTALYNALVNANVAGAVDPLDGIIDSSLHAGAKVGLARLGDHILIRPTRIGDLNLDGSVTISDFIDLAANFNTVGTATWQEGDLNYDKSVTISDFIDLAAAFNSNYAGSLGEISASDMQTLSSFASSIGVDPSVIGSAVPEPGTMSLLAIGGLGLLGRRRRNRKA